MANQMHQIDIAPSPDVLFVEQDGKVVKIVYKDGSNFVLTFRTFSGGLDFFNDNNFHDTESNLYAVGLESSKYNPTMLASIINPITE